MLLVTPGDPEYYAEILAKIHREAKRHKSIHGEFCPGGIDTVDNSLVRRLKRALDPVASISLCERGHGNVAAITASLKDNGGVLDMTLYLAFNRQPDQKAADHCRHHLKSIFEMLRCVPYKPTAVGNSHKIITAEFEHDLHNVYKTVHTYSFDFFKYRVLRWADKLEEIRAYVELDQTHFEPEQRTTLLSFLRHVDAIIASVRNAHTMDETPHVTIQLLSKIFMLWTKRQLLPEDPTDEDKLTLLDNADKWLADEYEMDFSLRRWAVKIMSFVISANRLFLLTQSRRLRKIWEGNFSIEILNSPAMTPYKCDLSRETMGTALNDALDETADLSADSNEERRSFIEWFEKKPDITWVERREPTVHAELVMIMAMDKGEINDVLPYIGVSKPSCIMCTHYISVYNRVTGQKIVAKGSHGKAYFGWSWPDLPWHRDDKLRPVFLQSIMQQLREDFKQYQADHRRKSDSNVGTDGLGLDGDVSENELDELIPGLGTLERVTPVGTFLPNGSAPTPI